MLSAPARADSNLFVGLSEDRFQGDPNAYAVVRDLGVTAVRVTLKWQSGQRALEPAESARLQNAVRDTQGVRVVLAVYGHRGDVPRGLRARREYCEYVRDAVARYPVINDVVLWIEPNLSFFWKPQFGPDGSSVAPAAYAALAARCWDVLHDLRPQINVIGPATSSFGSDNSDPRAGSVSHSPGAFIRLLGEAYAASGRTRPLFDTIGHHVYPASFGERPWRRHTNSRRISQGDWEKLMTELADAFAGTGQPIPGELVGGRTTPIWYLESGFETVPDQHKSGAYSGGEVSAKGPIPAYAGRPDRTSAPEASQAPDQATQLSDAIRLAYCQPYVEAWFNFLLQDEPELRNWQSGLLWADGTPKGSYGAFRDAVGDVEAGSVDCSRLRGGAVTPEPAAVIPRRSAASPSRMRVLLLRWPRHQRAGGRNAGLRIRIKVNADAHYVARLSTRVRRRRSAAGAGRVVRGFVHAHRVTWISFPRGHLAAGVYTIRLQLRKASAPLKVTQVSSPALRVGRSAARSR